jgi:putative methionine-R-sulfoxide reductase with GAF domain
MDPSLDSIAALLKAGGDRQVALEQALREVVKQFQSETATVHLLDSDKQLLLLAAQVGLPAALLEVVKRIPVGKGIAGQTVERGRPVTICNLQTDTGGVAKPGARQTGMGGALCVPLRDGDAIVGTIGVGTVRQHEYTAEETKRLEEIGRLLGAKVRPG